MPGKAPPWALCDVLSSMLGSAADPCRVKSIVIEVILDREIFMVEAHPPWYALSV